MWTERSGIRAGKLRNTGLASGNFRCLCRQKLWRKDDVHFVIIESRKAARDLRWEGVR